MNKTDKHNGKHNGKHNVNIMQLNKNLLFPKLNCNHR